MDFNVMEGRKTEIRIAGIGLLGLCQSRDARVKHAALSGQIGRIHCIQFIADPDKIIVEQPIGIVAAKQLQISAEALRVKGILYHTVFHDPAQAGI